MFHLTRWIVALVLALAWSAPLTAAGEGGGPIWLPIVRSDVGGGSKGGPTEQGIATYYNATGAGSCLFDASPEDMMVAAIDTAHFNGSALCGAYLRVTGPKGTVTVRIVDWCPDCDSNHIDLSREAFAQIADLPQGRVKVSWQMVSPALSGPIEYHFKDGSNQWWTAVQVRNHRNPVAKLEYLSAGGWVNVERTSYNYFVQSGPGMGPGPYTFRVTDVFGSVLVDSGIPHVEDGSVPGAAQFP